MIDSTAMTFEANLLPASYSFFDFYDFYDGADSIGSGAYLVSKPVVVILLCKLCANG